ncbi:20968_t:CDS:2 [Cetraspora pellucida]|uniref:20968_t:CDS:1 n=1 Tax=Cetraspora pellucida TaxID=1433469 RepID=A0A9N9GX74_9GLOM|nr:20968_t:CDS:2 [Cetraspora pellucida]
MVFASPLEKREVFKRQNSTALCEINVIYPMADQYIQFNETSWVIWDTTPCGDLTSDTVVQIIIYGWDNITTPPWPIVYVETAYFGSGHVEFEPETSWPYRNNYAAIVFPFYNLGLSGTFHIALDD